MTFTLFVLGLIALSLTTTLGFVLGSRMQHADDELLDEAFRHGHDEGRSEAGREAMYEIDDAFDEGHEWGYDTGFSDGMDQVPVPVEVGADETQEAA